MTDEHLNPFKSPECDSQNTSETKLSFLSKSVLLFVGAVAELAFATFLVWLYFLGGYWAVLAVIPGIPILVFCAIALFLRGWKQKRHVYLREKRAHVKAKRPSESE